MSMKTTTIDDLSVGTFVKVVKTALAMRIANSYDGGSDLGDVRSVKEVDTFAFKLNGDRPLASWLKPGFVEVVEGSLFDEDIDLAGDELICTSSDYSFWSVGTTYHVTRKGDEEDFCGCGCRGDEDDLGLTDGDGDFDGHPSASFINITRIKREMAEPSVVGTVSTAVAVVEVAPEPTKDPLTPFSELSDADKAELLLAKHEGKPVQLYIPILSAWRWAETPNWTEHLAYRLEPSATTELRLKANTLAKESDEAWIALNNLNKAA